VHADSLEDDWRRRTGWVDPCTNQSR